MVVLDADEDKEMAGMLTDYQEIVGFLRVHNLASINTQVHFLLPYLNSDDSSDILTHSACSYSNEDDLSFSDHFMTQFLLPCDDRMYSC